MSILEAKAHQVENITPQVGFEDIVGIIVTLIGLIANCRKKPEAAHRMLTRYGPVQRLRVKQIIKDRLGKADSKLEKAINNVAVNTTLSEYEAMVSEVE